MRKMSYNDVHVTTRTMSRTPISKLPYEYELTCHRCTGWALCLNDEIIAGEYTVAGLCVDIDGMIIVNTLEFEKTE